MNADKLHFTISLPPSFTIPILTYYFHYVNHFNQLFNHFNHKVIDFFDVYVNIFITKANQNNHNVNHSGGKAMLKNQLFGVEIEFTGITRLKSAQIVAEVLGSATSRPQNNVYRTRSIKDSKHRIWKIMRDSSISPSGDDETMVELVTPPLNYEDIELLQRIVRKIREAGGKSNSSCGIHIHIDGANHNPSSLKRLINFMTERQDLIYEALSISDSRASRWCRKLNKELLKKMKATPNLSKSEAERIWYSPINDGYQNGIDHSHYNTTRYHGINLHSYFSKGTVEFRLFNSTLHAGKIKAYIQFCLAVSAWAIADDSKVIFKSINGYTPKKKVTIMRNILTNRLGLYGEEFKTCRLWIMKNLKDKAELRSRNVA